MGESTKVVEWGGILTEYHVERSEAYCRKKIVCLEPRDIIRLKEIKEI